MTKHATTGRYFEQYIYKFDVRCKKSEPTAKNDEKLSKKTIPKDQDDEISLACIGEASFQYCDPQRLDFKPLYDLTSNSNLRNLPYYVPYYLEEHAKATVDSMMDEIDVLMNDVDLDFEQVHPPTLTVDWNTLRDPLYGNYSSTPSEPILEYPESPSLTATSKHPSSLCFSDQQSSIGNEISPNLQLVTSSQAEDPFTYGIRFSKEEQLCTQENMQQQLSSVGRAFEDDPSSASDSPSNDELYEQQLSDEDSSSTSDYPSSESIITLDETHLLYCIKDEVVEMLLDLCYRRHLPSDDGSCRQVPSSSSQRRHTASSMSSSNYTFSAGVTSPRGTRKRTKGQSTQDSNSGDESDGQPAKKHGITAKDGTNQPGRILACPFAIVDPVKYRQKCSTKLLRRIGDVRQHLERCHKLPIYCAICKDIFPVELERDAHTQRRECSIRSSPVEGITQHQWTQIRGVHRSKTEQQRWFIIFDILFPDYLPRPLSAYIDEQLSDDMQWFQSMSLNEGPDIIISEIQARGMLPLINGGDDMILLANAIRDGQRKINDRFVERQGILSSNAQEPFPQDHPIGLAVPGAGSDLMEFSFNIESFINEIPDYEPN